MSFNTDTIDKIDRLLEIESNYIANNIGSNITKTEKNNIRKNSRYIYKAISKINQDLGNKFLQAQDK